MTFRIIPNSGRGGGKTNDMPEEEEEEVGRRSGEVEAQHGAYLFESSQLWK